MPGLLEPFETETGIEANYSTFESDEMLETQLLTGKEGHDVVAAPDVRAPPRVTQPRSLDGSRVESRIWTRFRTGQ